MESYTPPVDLFIAPIPHLSCCVNFQSFSFWTACDIPSIEGNTTEQQQVTSRTSIYARQIDNKILRSNIHDIDRNHEYDTGNYGVPDRQQYGTHHRAWF